MFQPNGILAADTARDGLSSGPVRLRINGHREMSDRFGASVIKGLDRMSSFFGRRPLRVRELRRLRQARQFEDVENALRGKVTECLLNKRQMVLSVALQLRCACGTRCHC